VKHIIGYILALSWSLNAFAADVTPIHRMKITSTQSISQQVMVTEHALGRIQDPQGSTISAEVPARIQSVKVNVGSHVKQGDTLAILDSTDITLAISAAKSKLRSLQAQAKTQQDLVKRYQTLVKEKFISLTMLEQAQAQATVFNKSIQAARSQLKQAQHNARRTHIRAPFDGIVQQRMVAAGDYIGVGKPMFQLVGQSQREVILAIPETRIGDIHVGLPVHLHLPHNQTIVTANISELSPSIGSRNNALLAHIRFMPPKTWHTGGTVIADIVTAVHEHAVLVPEESVVLRPSGAVVYVLDGEHAQAVPVQTGIHQGNDVEIIKGLKAGIRIAQIGAGFLSDGAAIEVVKP